MILHNTFSCITLFSKFPIPHPSKLYLIHIIIQKLPIYRTKLYDMPVKSILCYKWRWQAGMHKRFFTYPVVAGDEEMVCPISTVPVRVLGRYKVDVVLDDVLEPVTGVVGVRPVDEPDYVHDADREEEGRGFVGAGGHEWALAALQLVDQLAFDGVDVVHGALVEERQVPFLVCPYPKFPLHLLVAPVG